VRRIVESRPGVTVTATVEEPGGGGTVRVSWVDGRVVVREGSAPDAAAARLAEMIRRDPTLLAPPD
jgi:hypothetical protein